jgi:ferric-dicitrate binding protein FerR (iron transport regulator)
MRTQSHHSNDYINKNLSQLKVPEGAGKQFAWDRLMEKVANEPNLKIIPFWGRMSAVAAVLVGLIAIGSLLALTLLAQVKHYSPQGTHLTVFLPDSSSVNLNADSYLEYNRVLWFISRKVSLKGEALFTVKKGKQFSVETGNVVTQVLGTTFNVYARNNEIRVSCIEGRVEVRIINDSERVVLSQMQSTKVIGDILAPAKEFSNVEMANWVKGEFYFQNALIKDVFGEIERQFNVKIKSDVDLSRRYSGVFYNKSLSESLDLVCVPMGLQWRVEKDQVIVFTNFN